jgi:hypothetical protein
MAGNQIPAVHPISQVSCNQNIIQIQVTDSATAKGSEPSTRIDNNSGLAFVPDRPKYHFALAARFARTNHSNENKPEKTQNSKRKARISKRPSKNCRR